MSNDTFLYVAYGSFLLMLSTPAFFAGRYAYGKMGIFGALLGISFFGFTGALLGHALLNNPSKFTANSIAELGLITPLLAFFLPAILPQKWLYRTPKQPKPQPTATDNASKHELALRRDERKHEKELIKLRMKEAKLQDKLRKNRELDERRRLQLENNTQPRKVNILLMPLDYLRNKISPIEIEANDIKVLPENKTKMIESKDWDKK